MKRVSIVVPVAAMLAVLNLPVLASAAAIASKDILPADGKTGQTLTTGNGVKTGHIQDLAISSTKIAAGAVTSAKIGTGEVKTANIAAGAVTDAQISGPIATSKLNVGTAAGTVAAGDHNHDSIYQKKYSNIIVVAKSGGDFTSPVNALNSITNASRTNPYLVKIMPGIYETGGAALTLKDYVELEGCGVEVTVITGSQITYNSQHSAIRNISLAGGIYAVNDSIVDIFNVKMASPASLNIISGSLKADHCELYNILIMNSNGRPNKIHNSRIVSNDSQRAISTFNNVITISDSEMNMDLASNNLGGASAIEAAHISIINTNITVKALNLDNKDTYILYTPSYPDNIAESNKIYNSNLTIEIADNVPYVNNFVVASFGDMEILNSNIRLTHINSNSNDHAVISYGLKMANSKVTSTGYAITHWAGVLKEITNSSVSGNGAVFFNNSFPGLFRVNNTKINGPTGLGGGDKMINCFDSNYNLLPNL